MTDIEETFKLNITTSKALLIDALLFGIIICAFLAGYWYGQKVQGEEKIAFFREYIETECGCSVPLIYKNGGVAYNEEKNIQLPIPS